MPQTADVASRDVFRAFAVCGASDRRFFSKGRLCFPAVCLALLGPAAGFAGADPGPRSSNSFLGVLAPAGEPASHEALGVCDRTIYFESGPVRAEGPMLPLGAVARDPASARAPRVIQLDGPITPQRRAALEDAGVRLGAYLPSNAYIARLDGANAAALEAIDFVRWHSEYLPDWKMSPGIGLVEYESAERIAIAARGDVAVVAALFPGEDAGEAALKVLGIEGVKFARAERLGELDVVIAVLPERRAAELAAIEAVQYVQEHPEATLRNSNTRWIVQSNIPLATPAYDHGMSGQGQILGVIDTFINVNHCSFLDVVPVGASHRKILAYNASQFSSAHGTHVAATAVGNAGLNNDTRGVAYSARLVYSPIPAFITGSFTGALQLHHQQGARVHTNSWGSDGSVEYNIWSREIDAFTHAHEDDLVIVAISNLSTVRTPENAKNAFAVAATQNHPNQSKHGSGGAGPTADGRLKPELCAPGASVSSADNLTSCGVRSLLGTSMAAPSVAGAALIVRQYFTQGRFPDGMPDASRSISPSGALLRAMLINTGEAMDSYEGYPNEREGWGRLLLDRSLPFPDDPRQLQFWDVRREDPEALVTGAANEHGFRVLGGGESLRVTLVFTDPPAALGAAVARVNDLDLKVTSPGGQVYRGNTFSDNGYSLADGRFLPSMGLDFDPMNTVEQVYVTSPQVGNWSVEVRGAAVNQGGSQGYAVVVTGAVSAMGACGGSDLNGDGLVNAQDLALLLSAWENFKSFPLADLNGDQEVNAQDLALLLSYWGPCL